LSQDKGQKKNRRRRRRRGRRKPCTMPEIAAARRFSRGYYFLHLMPFVALVSLFSQGKIYENEQIHFYTGYVYNMTADISSYIVNKTTSRPRARPRLRAVSCIGCEGDHKAVRVVSNGIAPISNTTKEWPEMDRTAMKKLNESLIVVPEIPNVIMVKESSETRGLDKPTTTTTKGLNADEATLPRRLLVGSQLDVARDG
jgi:hypothetical protein